MFRRLLKFGIKASILTGAVYYTVDQGLWEDTEKADQVYGELYKAVVPYVKEVSVEVPEIPSASDFALSTKLYYNQGVVATGNFLRNLPSKTLSLACELKTSFGALLEASQSEKNSSDSVPSEKSS